MENKLEEPDLSLITYLAIIDNQELKQHPTNETLFITDLLQNLYKIDQEAWPNNKTKNLNDQDFEFYH